MCTPTRHRRALPAGMFPEPGAPARDISLRDLLTHYQPLCAPTWEDDFELLDNNAGDTAIIDQLRIELRRDGRFRQPIRLDARRHQVDNGHHRIRAAVAEHHPTIYAETHDPERRYPADTYVAARFTHQIDVDDIDTLDDLIATLRSLAVDEHRWAESDLAGGHPGQLTIYYMWPHDQIDDLTSALRRHIEHQQLNITVETVTADTDDD